MGFDLLDLPGRSAKPRVRGLTMVIDNGMPHGGFADAMTTAAPHIDLVKFGWGTAVVTPDLERKLEVLNDLGIKYYFGGTLFEKFVVQERFDAFVDLCRACGCEVVEISNGTVPMPGASKAAYIRRCAEEFTVLSEVGFKDADRSDLLTAGEWVDAIRQDLDAGAAKVITEARESGRAGICTSDGRLRDELIEEIVSAGIGVDDLIFEAPTKALQTRFITMFDTNVNLGNIAPADVIGVETLRLGLRSDTFLHFEAVSWRA